MKFSFIKQLFYFLTVVVLFFSCNNEVYKADVVKKSELYFCKIITSSSDKTSKLLDTTVWETSNIAKDDIIFVVFYESFYINKVELLLEPKITKVKVYSNNGIIGFFSPEELIIDDTVSFLIFKIDEVEDFHLTKAYKDSSKYQIAFENLNHSATINQLKFYKNDSTEIDVIPLKNALTKTEFIVDFLDKKTIDYSNSDNSFILKSTGEFIGSSYDTIYLGAIYNDKKEHKLNIKKFIFTENNYQTENIETNIKLKENYLAISHLADFMFDFEDDYLVDVSTLDSSIIHDMRYATDNNFTGKVIYDCPVCLFRYGAAKYLVSAQKEFQKLGYRIKVFDCYRPHRAQYKLWEIMPNINFVANPEKGSIHNRGAAVDLTLVDSLGNELDMGTEFDYFGYKAFSINMDLPDTVLHNRQLMWDVMKKNGFMTIKTEWWHMSHWTCLKYEICDLPLPCE